MRAPVNASFTGRNYSARVSYALDQKTKNYPVATAVVIAAVYFAIAALTVRYTRFEGGVAFIWIASGFLIGILASIDRRRWLNIIVCSAASSLLATWLFGLGREAALPLALVNLGEAALGAWLLTRFRSGSGDLRSVREIAILIAVVGVVAPILSAFFGAAIVAIIFDLPYWTNWWGWYAGHALGGVIFTPVVVLVARGEMSGWLGRATTAQRCETAALLAVLAAITGAVFAQNDLPLLFLPFLPMMVAVFRLGRLGAAASLIVIAVIGGAASARGIGPISLIDGTSGLRTQIFQLYLATAVLMVLPAAGDLGRKKQTVEQLEEQAVLHRLILDHTSDVIMTLDLTGRIRFVSASSQRVFGLPPTALVGSMPHDIIHPDDIARVVAVHRDVLLNPDRTFTVEYRGIVGGCEIGWFETHARATQDAAGRPSGAVVIVRDVSHRKTAETRLSQAALTDQLTGIANRRAFDAALAQRLGAGLVNQPAVIAMFDLDHFKVVNDTFGHAGGDEVLKSFAEILRTGIREGDVIGRLGGEEFGAIISGDLDAARMVCERVRLRLAENSIDLSSGQIVDITVSIGLAPLPPNGSPVPALAQADAALYEAKRTGRNRVASAPATVIGPGSDTMRPAV